MEIISYQIWSSLFDSDEMKSFIFWNLTNSICHKVSWANFITPLPSNTISLPESMLELAIVHTIIQKKNFFRQLQKWDVMKERPSTPHSCVDWIAMKYVSHNCRALADTVVYQRRINNLRWIVLYLIS